LDSAHESCVTTVCFKLQMPSMLLKKITSSFCKHTRKSRKHYGNTSFLSFENHEIIRTQIT